MRLIGNSASFWQSIILGENHFSTLSSLFSYLVCNRFLDHFSQGPHIYLCTHLLVSLQHQLWMFSYLFYIAPLSPLYLLGPFQCPSLQLANFFDAGLYPLLISVPLTFTTTSFSLETSL